MAKKQAQNNSYTDNFRQAVENHRPLIETRDAAAAEIDRLKVKAAEYRQQATEVESKPIDTEDPVEAARTGRENKQAAEDLRVAAQRVESQLAPAEKALEAAEKQLRKAVSPEIGNLAQLETERVSVIIEGLLDELDTWNRELTQVTREYGVRGSFPSRPKILSDRRLEHYMSVRRAAELRRATGSV